MTADIVGRQAVSTLRSCQRLNGLPTAPSAVSGSKLAALLAPAERGIGPQKIQEVVMEGFRAGVRTKLASMTARTCQKECPG